MHLIGVVTALRDEASCITSGAIPFNEKQQLNDQTLLWLSGMGAQAAQVAAQGLCHHGATALVSFGVAGALHADLKPGDLVLPNAIASDQAWPVDLAWQQRLRQILQSSVTVVDGVLADSAVPLTDERSKTSRERAVLPGRCERTEWSMPEHARKLFSCRVGTFAAGAGRGFLGGGFSRRQGRFERIGLFFELRQAHRSRRSASSGG